MRPAWPSGQPMTPRPARWTSTAVPIRRATRRPTMTDRGACTTRTIGATASESGRTGQTNATSSSDNQCTLVPRAHSPHIRIYFRDTIDSYYAPLTGKLERSSTYAKSHAALATASCAALAASPIGGVLAITTFLEAAGSLAKTASYISGAAFDTHASPSVFNMTLISL